MFKKINNFSILHNKYKKFLIIIPVIISIVVYYRWFSFHIFRHGDWPFYFSNSLMELGRVGTWVSNSNLGYFSNVILWRKPLEFCYGIFGYLGFNSNVADFYLIFLPIILLIPIGSYLLIKKILRSNLAALIGSIIFSFNTYFLTINTEGHFLLTVACSMLVFSLIFLCFSKITTRNIVLGLLFLLLSGIYDFRFAYIGLFIIFSYCLFILIIKKLSFRDQVKLIGIPIISSFFLIVNLLFWVLVVIATNSINNNSAVDRGLFGNDFYDLFYSLTLHHPFWNNGGYIDWFTLQSIPIYFWILPFFAFIGLILNRKDLNILFFGFLSLLGILLTKQVDMPFSNMYLWLYLHLPGFNAFREASKFYILICISYSVLISSFINYVREHFFKNNWGRIFTYFITIFVVLLFVFNSIDVFNSKIGQIYKPASIPKDYLILKSFISNQNKYFRTFWVPTYSQWSYNSETNPRVSDIDTIQSTLSDYSSIDSNKLTTSLKDQVLNILNNPYSSNLWSKSSIKYFIVPSKDVDNDDNFFSYYGEQQDPDIRNYYISQLDNLSYLKRVDIGTKDLIVYENTNYKPYIDTTTSMNGFSSIKNLDQKYSFLHKDLNKDFDFLLVDKNRNIPSNNIYNVFEDITYKNISRKYIFSQLNLLNDHNLIYTNKSIFNMTINSDTSDNDIKFSSTTNENLEFITASTSIKKQIKFNYNNNYTFTNIISNPSFENGFWQSEVSDCNAYDSNKKLIMKIDYKNKTNGQQSLELDAINHIACTSINVNVHENSNYLFDFDFQSPNAEQAGYYLGFNDSNNTDISDRLNIRNKYWNNLTKIIKIPQGATKLSLFIYSYSKDDKTNIITRYDNFHLIELPNDILDYWLVDDPQTNFISPSSTTFDLINPTKKLVHITGATTPFYLSMSEAYHDQWQLEMNNSKINGWLNKWIPWAHPDMVPNDQHFKLDDFLNGWYVDVPKLCVTQHYVGCTQNSDGSYNLEMVIEFWPQRWFYVGLIISGTTLIGILSYLGYDLTKRIKNRKKKRKLQIKSQKNLQAENEHEHEHN